VKDCGENPFACLLQKIATKSLTALSLCAGTPK
jgi:hypothetical protein